MLKHLITALFLLLLSSNSAFAKECDYTQAQGLINQCTYEKYQAADKILNQTYQTLYKSILLNPRNHFAVEDQKALKKAQLAWIKYRDLDCIYDAGLAGDDGGMMNQMFYNDCLTRRTKERTIILRQFFANLSLS